MPVRPVAATAAVLVPTPAPGYRTVASDGGIFASGDAAFFGAAADRSDRGRLPAVIGMVATGNGAGSGRSRPP